ncbi:uncharacterized protein VP01_1670g2 [Puccinia sorghi]|uniref:Uncharacterized protein n=1 Tax=Puccinia sorghi TaxID=27349 RepID=A0A0L6VG58_9BASI|nr:uncharacterized protein VP01_1670g2 [Puccinia sorghi]
MPSLKSLTGDKTKNLIAVREKLNNLIAKASQNPTEKWPGNTEKGLAKLGLTLRIKSGNPAGINCRDFVGRPADMRNGQLQHILTAFGEGWVELLGSSRAPAPTTLGAVLGGKQSCRKEVSSPAAEGSPSSVPEGSPSSVQEQEAPRKKTNPPSNMPKSIKGTKRGVARTCSTKGTRAVRQPLRRGRRVAILSDDSESTASSSSISDQDENQDMENGSGPSEEEDGESDDVYNEFKIETLDGGAVSQCLCPWMNAS